MRTTKTKNKPVRRFLVLDDEVSIRVLLTRLLTRESWTVVAVESGQEALDRFTAELFDAAILDVDIGNGYDGIAVAQTMRQLAPELKIIIMSGNGGHADRVRDAGFGELLTKPFEIQSLIARLRFLMF